MTRTLGLALGIFLLIVALLAFNVIASRVLAPVRLDVTQGRQFTLTQGSRAIAKSPAEPVTLTFSYSAGLVRGNTGLETYARRVRELLEEFARASNGKVRLEVVDPEPFSEAEDAAVEAGLTGVPGGPAGENIFFGLVGRSSVDTREVIPFFDPQRERFLEYDIARLIGALARVEKPVLGIMSPLQMDGGFRIDPRTRQPQQTPPWAITEELKKQYDVRTIAPNITRVPTDVDVLLVAHPRELSRATLYAIDQFVVSGGRTIVAIDPLCENDPTAAMRGFDVTQAGSNLEPLLSAWGVEMPSGTLAADQDLALRVSVGRQGAPEAVPFVIWLRLGEEQLASGDPVTGDLSAVNVASAGLLRAKAGSEGGLTMTPLLQTTARASTIAAEIFASQPDPRQLFAEFVPGSERLTIAARLSGRARSAFPDGAPELAEGQMAPQPAIEHQREGTTDANVIVIADCDWLWDGTWMRQEDFLGMRAVRTFADNDDLLLGMVDNFAGSTDLIRVRARAETSRPFTRVEEMQRLAEQQYQKEQVALEQRLRETERRLAELQAQRGDDASGGVVLSAEQQAEVERFREEMVQTRRELRSVQLNLRRDVEKLGTTVKIVNAAAAPAAVIGAALVIMLLRARARATARKQAGAATRN